jgi:hypothetical protein
LATGAQDQSPQLNHELLQSFLTVPQGTSCPRFSCYCDHPDREDHEADILSALFKFLPQATSST